jgi:hypothetical protein
VSKVSKSFTSNLGVAPLLPSITADVVNGR